MQEETLSGREIQPFWLSCSSSLIAFGAPLWRAPHTVAKNHRRADMDRAMESVFAEYQKDLLEEYELLAPEGS